MKLNVQDQYFYATVWPERHMRATVSAEAPAITNVKMNAVRTPSERFFRRKFVLGQPVKTLTAWDLQIATLLT